MLLAEGFIPVLHGDCVLDDSTGCSILSSDSILRVCDFKDFFHLQLTVFLDDIFSISLAPFDNAKCSVSGSVSVWL